MTSPSSLGSFLWDTLLLLLYFHSSLLWLVVVGSGAQTSRWLFSDCSHQIASHPQCAGDTRNKSGYTPWNTLSSNCCFLCLRGRSPYSTHNAGILTTDVSILTLSWRPLLTFPPSWGQASPWDCKLGWHYKNVPWQWFLPQGPLGHPQMVPAHVSALRLWTTQRILASVTGDQENL